MIIKQSQLADEFEASVREALLEPEPTELDMAMQSLAQAADTFEAAGMEEESEVITQFMESIASGEFSMIKEAKKKAKKDKKPAKKKEMVPFFRKNLDFGEMPRKKKACQCEKMEEADEKEDDLDMGKDYEPFYNVVERF